MTRAAQPPPGADGVHRRSTLAVPLQALTVLSNGKFCMGSARRLRSSPLGARLSLESSSEEGVGQ